MAPPRVRFSTMPACCNGRIKLTMDGCWGPTLAPCSASSQQQNAGLFGERRSRAETYIASAHPSYTLGYCNPPCCCQRGGTNPLCGMECWQDSLAVQACRSAVNMQKVTSCHTLGTEWHCPVSVAHVCTTDPRQTFLLGSVQHVVMLGPGQDQLRDQVQTASA